MTGTAEASQAFEAFAAIHHGDRPFLLPNAWDIASGLLLERAGFPAVGTTSLGVNAAAGLRDGAGTGREATVALALALVPKLRVPLTVDVENGYSEDPAEVADLVAALAAAGVAGVNLEDGRPDGTLRPAAAHAAVVGAAVAAAPGLFVNARTDTYWLGAPAGTGTDALAETLSRVAAYRDAGAAGVFVPGLTDPGDTARVAGVAKVPLNVLWRPDADLSDLAAAGVARVSTGSALYRQALASAVDTASRARDGWSVQASPVGYGELQDLLGHR